jgi:hypothetical protein
MVAWPQPRWADPIKLADWKLAPATPGLYAIGVCNRPNEPPGPALDNDGKLGGLPTNLHVLYIGRSLDRTRGIRGRLSRHARGRGNRRIARQINETSEFWFCHLVGDGAAGLETLYLYFVPGIRPEFNQRPELLRTLKEQYEALVRTDWVPLAPLCEDQIAPAGPTSIDGLGRFPWT